jgi:hypothetical protein
MLMQQLGLGQATPGGAGSGSDASASALVAAAVTSTADAAAGPLPAPSAGVPASTPPLAAPRPPTDLDPALTSQLVCPITQELMADPVFAADGTTFERSAIQGGCGGSGWVVVVWCGRTAMVGVMEQAGLLLLRHIHCADSVLRLTCLLCSLV